MTEPQTIGQVAEQIDSLRDRLDLVWKNHEREHKDHETSHNREHEFAQKAIDTAAALAKENKADANEWRATMNDREVKFATKDDVKAILGRLDNIERAGILSVERERQRIADDAEEKLLSERRQSRQQWQVGIVVTFVVIVVNLAIRLLTT